MTELIERLPRHDAFHANFAPEVTNWLPFYWAGFSATAHYTYRIDDLSDVDALWAGLASSIRGHIRRAQRELVVRTDLGLEHLLEINRKTFRRQGLAVPFDDDLAQRLDRACAARDARSIVCAVDAQDRVHAACCVVRDNETSYLLYGGADPELRGSSGEVLMLWEAIRQAAARTRRFDFLGSMMESAERNNRGFGARQVPYFFVSRERPHARALLAARKAVDTGIHSGLPRLAGKLRGLTSRS